MGVKRCRICDGPVENVERNWIELSRLGRFYVCDRHRERAFFVSTESGAWLYHQDDKPGFFSLGPYPYEPGKVQG